MDLQFAWKDLSWTQKAEKNLQLRTVELLIVNHIIKKGKSY